MVVARNGTKIILILTLQHSFTVKEFSCDTKQQFMAHIVLHIYLPWFCFCWLVQRKNSCHEAFLSLRSFSSTYKRMKAFFVDIEKCRQQCLRRFKIIYNCSELRECYFISYHYLLKF